MADLDIRIVPVLSDNYVYLAHDPETETCAAVDPAVAEPVLKALDELGWRLTHVLCHHHHMDHIGGNLEVKQATGCTIVGARRDAARIPGIDVEVGEDETLAFGSQTARVFEVPGHTSGHIAYWFENSAALFSGDTLFSLGCGRVFEGDMEMMWASLARLIRKLPADTTIYCGHEYTAANAKFALTIDPDNEALKKRAAEVDTLRSEGQPTLPTTMGQELATNPFLRANDPGIRKNLGLEDASDADVFAEIRTRKDNA